MRKLEVIKRDGSKQEFTKEKIEQAIIKAMKYGSKGVVRQTVAKNIAEEIEEELEDKEVVNISDIETLVYYKLISKKHKDTARDYEGYRKIREMQRTQGTIDKEVMGLVYGTNKELLNENSNKNESLTSTVRDLVAEEVSKDIAMRTMLPPHIVKAHKDGIIHLHDLGHYLNKSPNCTLVNLKDMLDNGTCINAKLVESPHRFTTACTIATQIVAQVASGQFGGQTISIAHLAPYLRKSKEKFEKDLLKTVGNTLSDENFKAIIDMRVQEELSAGVQTINYQCNTMQSSNGM